MSSIRKCFSLAIASSTVVLAPVAITPALAQQDAQPTTMLVIESAGLGSVFHSDKDKALRDAFAMIPGKFSEYRAMVPDLQEIPEFMTDTAFTALSSPWRLGVTDQGFDQQSGSPGVGIVMSFQMPKDNGKAHADSMHQTISTLMMMSGMPMEIGESDKYNTMSAFTVPFMFPVPVSFGPREAKDGWRYEFHLGAVSNPDQAFMDMPVDRGVDTVMSGKIDLASFTPYVNMAIGMAQMAGPEVGMIFDSLSETGLIGEDAITMEFTSGYKGNQSLGRYTMKSLGLERGLRMGLTDMVVTKGDLAVIPQDSTFAEIRKFDMQAQWDQMREQLGGFVPEEQMEEGLGMFRQMTGFDLETQVIPSLGNTVTFYISDTTGGSSWMSSTMLLSLNDSETFSSFWNSMTNMVNAMVAEETAGQLMGMRFASYEHSGASFSQMQFPGLPIPFEPTFSVSGDWLVVGITPQACHAAVNQAKKNRGGLNDNKAFSKAMKGAPDMTSIVFVDSARTLRDGYPYVTMLGSAVSNFVRANSLDGPNNGPGMVVPTYAELAEGVSPAVMYTYWDGDDFVARSVSDSSILVNIAAVLGIADIGDIISSALVGGGIGAAISEQTHSSNSSSNDWEEWDEGDDDEWEEDEHVVEEEEHEHEHEHEHELH